MKDKDWMDQMVADWGQVDEWVGRVLAHQATPKALSKVRVFYTAAYAASWVAAEKVQQMTEPGTHFDTIWISMAVSMPPSGD